MLSATGLTTDLRVMDGRFREVGGTLKEPLCLSHMSKLGNGAGLCSNIENELTTIKQRIPICERKPFQSDEQGSSRTFP